MSSERDSKDALCASQAREVAAHAQGQGDWERFGEYFTGRSAADVMEEYSEQHDEWRRLETGDER